MFTLFYQGQDITSSLGDGTAVTYTDHEHNKADEIQVEIADPNGLWRGAYYPDQGDVMSLSIGSLPCGTFEVDEPEPSGSRDGGDIFSISGLSIYTTGDLRTKRSKAYEKTTLKKIVNQVAGRNGLEVSGEIDEVKIDRATQNNERDLKFLGRLAKKYNHVFSIKGTKLVFAKIEDLETAPPVFWLVHGMNDDIDWSLSERMTGLYKEAKISYKDTANNKIIKHSEQAEGLKSGDILLLDNRIETKAEAKKVCKSALREKNQNRVTANFSMIGNPLFVAGINVFLFGYGKRSGKFHITTSRHVIDRSGGYITEWEGYRVFD